LATRHPEQRLLVDTLIDCEWLLRRFRKSEAQLWHCKMQEAEIWKPDPELLLGLAFNRGCEEFSRLQRRIDSTSRNYHRALKELQRLDSERRQPDPPPAPASAASQSPDPRPRPLAPRAKPAPRPHERSEPTPALGDNLAERTQFRDRSARRRPLQPTPPPPPAPFPHPFSPPRIH